MKLLDVVKTKAAIGKLLAGSEGTIVFIYDPCHVMVEFDDGVLLDLPVDKLEVVRKHRRRDS